jgi:hypothetical protein
MRRSALAVITLTAVLAVAACTPDSAERGPLVPTQPSLAAGDLCAGGLASDISKQQKALFSGAALTDLQNQFSVIKSLCPNASSEMMTYLDAMLGYYGAPTTALRAGQVATHLASVTLYVTATAVVRPSSVFMNQGGAGVLSPGEFMTTYDQGARLEIASGTFPGGPHLFTFEPKANSFCDGTTSLRTTGPSNQSLRGAGADCFDIHDYPDETATYVPAATLTLCMRHTFGPDIGIVHQKAGYGGEVLPPPAVNPTFGCGAFHTTSNSWLGREAGPLGRVLAKAYDYLRPQPLIADDVGESGSIGSFSLVGGILNVIFEDDFNDPLTTPPDVGDAWTVNATSPGYIQIQQGLGNLNDSVVVLSQAQGNCANCPVFTLLGTRANSTQSETIGTYEVTWQSLQNKPNVKEAPFVILNSSGAEIARVAYSTESSANKIRFNGQEVGTWDQNVAQSFKVTVRLTQLNGVGSQTVTLSINDGADTTLPAPNATSFGQIGYVLTGIDAGIIAADNFRVIRVSDIP